MKKFFSSKMNNCKNIMNQEHEGAVAFEYIIILVIMAVAIFAAWGILSAELKQKAEEIKTFIANNGTSSLGNTPAASNP